MPKLLLIILFLFVIRIYPLTEKQAVDSALCNNFKLHIAEINQETADIEKRSAIMGYLPKLETGFNDTLIYSKKSGRPYSMEAKLKQKNPYGGVFSIHSGDVTRLRDSNDLYMAFSQPLLSGFIFDRKILLSGLEKKRAGIDFRARVLDEISTVRSTFWKTVLAKQSLSLALAAEKASRVNYEIALERHRLGLIRKVDLLEAERELFEKKNGILKAENILGNSLSRLGFITGISRIKPGDIPDSISAVTAVPVNDFDSKKAAESSLAVRIAKIDLEKAQASEKGLFRTRFPELYLKVGLPADEPDDFFTGFSLSYTFGDFSPSHEHRLGELVSERRSVSLEELVGNTRITIEEKLRNLVFLRRSLNNSEKSVKISGESRRLHRELFKSGETSSKELIESENRYHSEKLDYIQSLIDYKTEMIEFYRITGSYDIEIEK
ncbi:MAG: TolC family protein [Fibrobacterota bacterium]